VWCGDHHQLKVSVRGLEEETAWFPMGWWLVRLGVEPFVIDQAVTVEHRGHGPGPVEGLRPWFDVLESTGGTAAWLVPEAPDPWRQPGADAVLVSTRNRLE
jgi:hypothetical protein